MFNHVNGNNVHAVFFVDDIQFAFAGVVSPGLPPFTASRATLTYNNIGELSGSLSYRGEVSIDTLTLTFSNGLKIHGHVNPPGVDPPISIVGQGTWEGH